MKQIVIDKILIPAIKRLYQTDYDNIRFNVSERNICARLAHHMENIMREYDQAHNNRSFIEYYVDVEYNRMGNGDPKHFENSQCRPQYMVSDLLIHNRGYNPNLLAVEMKKEGNNKKVQEDKDRLVSLVSPMSDEINIRCVHNTLVGAFIVYSSKDITIEFYENQSVNGQDAISQCRRVLHYNLETKEIWEN